MRKSQSNESHSPAANAAHCARLASSSRCSIERHHSQMSLFANTTLEPQANIARQRPTLQPNASIRKRATDTKRVSAQESTQSHGAQHCSTTRPQQQPAPKRAYTRQHAIDTRHRPRQKETWTQQQASPRRVEPSRRAAGRRDRRQASRRSHFPPLLCVV